MDNAMLAQAPAAEAPVAPVKPKPVEKPAPVEAPAKSEPATAAKAKPEAKPEIKPEAKPAAKPEAKPSVDADAEREVMEAVNGWAQAWSTRDVQGYLNHYGSDFRTPGGQSRKRWEEDRRIRIVGKERITVTIGDPKVTISGNRASVKFRQTYVSDSFTANTNKTLMLSRQNGKWLIQQELAGN
jgi:ketosteroid isomerase-like protein